MHPLSKRSVPVVLSMIFLLLPAAGWSQARKAAKYPAKPTDLIVAAAPGAGTDTVARMVAGYASKRFGVPVNVVNVTGASGVTGTLQVMRAAPDGYNLLVDGNFTSSFMFATRTDLPAKLEDRTFVARVTTDYVYFFCNAGTGWKTLEEALQSARSRPEEFRWGAGLYGSTPMFTQIDLFLAAGMNMEKIKKTRMVVFEKGNAPSMQACITGDVQFAVGMSADVASLLATKRVRVLAVNAPGRTKEYPDVPTTKELGYPEADLMPWYGISGPKGLPEPVVKAWDDLIRGAAKDPEAQAAAAKALKTWRYLPPAEYKASILKEYEQIISVASALGIRR